MIKGTFLGHKMSQMSKCIWLWEQVLSSVRFKRILEFGTLRGNLSLFFRLFADSREAEFYTYDIKKRWSSPFKEKLGLGDYFHQEDIFLNIEKIGKIIGQEGLSVVFCDNGKKPREFTTFAPYLKVGDIIAVHDWKTEIFPADVEKGCEQYKLKEIFSKESDEEGLTRFFQKYA